MCEFKEGKELSITIIELWSPSVQLRFLIRNNGTLPNGEWKTEKVLQQLFTSNLGNIEWKDVPIIETINLQS